MIGKLTGQRELGKMRFSFEDNIKIDLIQWYVVEWI
jgi:hypothetical protein